MHFTQSQKVTLSHPDKFTSRHLGPQPADMQEMLDTVGVDSLPELIRQTLPDSIRNNDPFEVVQAMTEHGYLNDLRQKAALNKVFKTYIGLGYHDCITPSVILRNIFENPGWYTQYTPYQAEISQGRLEALLNFQTMVSDLTGLPVANASLLDEGTAAAEAAGMTYSQKAKKDRKWEGNTLWVSDKCFPQTIDVIRTRMDAIGVEVVVGDLSSTELHPGVFAAIVQYPDAEGAVKDFESLAEELHAQNSFLIVAADLMSLALLQEPAGFGADVVVGNTQRFGVPLGYGGPHAAYFATKEEFLRLLPGRIIGVSVDIHGNPGLRMALQTREQHIRRDKATSNICTAQALLAIMAGMYAVYHGPKGIRQIASHIHNMTALVYTVLDQMGLRCLHGEFFDTLTVEFDSPEPLSTLKQLALEAGVNFHYVDDKKVSLSINETTTSADLNDIVGLFASATGQMMMSMDIGSFQSQVGVHISAENARTTPYLTHPVFSTHHSETAMMRYIHLLEGRDLSLNTAMIPLGSCTMKLNAATQLIPVSWPEFGKIHPFVPVDQAEGYKIIIDELEEYLCKITGFAGMSFQPNSGAQGEYTGLMVIRAYHQNNGDAHRKIALIPDSAHGTNPASAVMAGMKVVVVKTDDIGNVDIEDLAEKAEKYQDNLACLMVTYPSTFGVFEGGIKDMCEIIHKNGGQVYMDGANMNAQVGLTSPGYIGADVCHLNLHKTFAIPHGGGGPGMGPIGVAPHLTKFLPGHSLVKTGGETAITPIASAPYSSASILLISYAYIKMLGSEGLTDATRYAILNANYMKARLRDHYRVLFEGENGRVAHEFILDMRDIKHDVGIGVDDITKRLIDYGFHAPTVSWPVAGTIMIEPTESEPKAEMDRFCDAMIAIKNEINKVASGEFDAKDNVLVNSPHTLAEITTDEWAHPYSRQEAAFPMKSLHANKFWPFVGRVDNTSGDRNVVCTCPPIEAYAE